MKVLLGVFASFSILCSHCLATDSKTSLPRKPNIILVLADNVGYGDLSLHGNPHVKSPHLDGGGDVRELDGCQDARPLLMRGAVG